MNHQEYDNYLLNSLVTGDASGIKKIYEKIYPKVLGYIYKHQGSEDDAKDIMQKGLLQLAARAQTKEFTITSSFEAYLFTTCKNAWRRESKMSKLRVTNTKTLTLISEEREIALAAYEQEKWELFQEKMNSISENCRKVLKSYFNKIPYAQIAKELGYASENTVRQRIFKCKSKLREAVQSDLRYKELKEL